jgi:hypothetical protein
MRFESVWNCLTVFMVTLVQSPLGSDASNSTTTTTSYPSSFDDALSPEDLPMLFRMLLQRGNGFVFPTSASRTSLSAPQWVIGYFDRIAEISSTPEKMLTVPTIGDQIRAIGREIYEAHGHEGMVQVCEYKRQYKAFIERAWDGIGRWMA